MNKRTERFSTPVLALLVLAATAPGISAQELVSHPPLEMPEDVRVVVAGLTDLNGVTETLRVTLQGLDEQVKTYWERHRQLLADSLIGESLVFSEPQFFSWRLALGGTAARWSGYKGLIDMWRMADFTQEGYPRMIRNVETYAAQSEAHARYLFRALEGFPMADSFAQPFLIESALYSRAKELLEEMRSR